MRLANWERELEKVIVDAQTKIFLWGFHDCITFAADAVRAMTGVDPIADLRGKWPTALSATRMLREIGGIESAVCSRMGERLNAPRAAGRGDVILSDAGGVAIVVLGYAVAPMKFGLMRIEMDHWTTGWRVG